jgi:23S rRNA (guanosine2251-2'-O)-methyltransferase
VHLEGQISVLAALAAARRRIEVILLRQGMHPSKRAEIETAAGARGVPLRLVDDAEIDALTHGRTHGGVAAICSPMQRMSEPQLLDSVSRLREPPLLLLLEGLEDARNLGFTLRTADAMGVHAVLIKKHLWEFDETEIARPASGALERVPLVQFETVDLVVELRRRGVQIIGCLARARRTIYDAQLREPTMLAIGGEKRGLSGALRAVCTEFTAIPTRGGAASLSLSHAGAIAMGEAYRQRRHAPA